MPFRLKCLSSPTGISNYPMIWRNLICLKIFWLRLSYFKSLIFAKITLAEDEYRLYKSIDIVYRNAQPDLYLFVSKFRATFAEYKERGRSMNPADYLDKINTSYLEYIKSQTELNVLIIDVSDKR
jgi:deoxyadenosine/deoxycytidine kinase